MPALDPAVRRALGLPASAAAQVSPHGGSGFSRTAKISCASASGAAHEYFVKTGRGASAATMFAGEHASLSALHAAVPTLCPASLGAGELDAAPGTHFLVTEFLDLGARGPAGAGSGLTLAQKLARLHAAPAPPPEGRDAPAFGFPVATCCGDTPQPNGWAATWAEFFADRRLRAVAARIEARHGADAELRALVERTAGEVVPRLLRVGHLGGDAGIVPVAVHGDLWAGNHGRGRIGGRDGVEDVVFDPSSCYAHSEFELGIMKMFGGFGGAFLAEYHSLVPKTEPQDEYADRVALYELYHHLNHTAIFGGGYRSGAMAIMRELCGKYAS